VHLCGTCGKEWPENYCPECCHTIGEHARRAVPPPLPQRPAESGPPAIPPRGARATSKKSFPPWAIVTLALLAALLAGAAFAYRLYKSFAFPPGYRNRPTVGWGVRKGEQEFDSADTQINSFQGTNAFGNSPQAVELANRFSEALKTRRAEMFTPGSKLEILDNTRGEFITFCELHTEECAFIVHVPQLRKYDKNVFEDVDARKLLARLAWTTAQEVLKKQGADKPEMELAVGLRGISQYGPIMLGYYDVSSKGTENGVLKYLHDGAQTHFLWTFFAPDGERRVQ